MDAFQCHYKVYSIYTTTWFIKRADKYHFIASSLTISSDAEKISVREAFLFMMNKAANDDDSF